MQIKELFAFSQKNKKLIWLKIAENTTEKKFRTPSNAQK